MDLPSATPTPIETAAQRKVRDREEAKKDREGKEAAARFEKKKAEDNMKARVLLAELLEKGMLSKGMDMHVSAVGKGKKQLRIQWVLAGRPFSYQQGHDTEFVATLRAAGFESLYILDGYNFGETWDIR